ncbi:class I SAM-dependent DNA methyltransferase [Nonomuraea sp. MCN248]|uniref:site-specific DNA-methyltransferase (adenine-specific) n=1 Tax=Nonomuraea corallina TaxID=2989783 RepID=A0ABT4S5Q4_9ACTN|nr:class I SAM-dependent DNA methyltransferase [Nonomuraea corallina]MDA0632534.1 class I SAM-dependent DNA methyltransferase [Nonomuraea corallina]
MSTTETRRLVAQLWNYCDVLRDDGVSTIDYVEQLTYLLFLKMAHERASRRFNADDSLASVAARWQALVDAEAAKLEELYRRTLEDLGRAPGTLGIIFRKAQNRIQDPAKLKRLIVDLIDKENWSSQGADVKGDAYEELLAKGAEDVKTGAGQYFTPRALISAMVDCIQPGPNDTIADPACGTGGFLLAAHEYIVERYGSLLTPEQRDRLNSGAISGTELVDGTARLAAMNMLVHGIGKPNGASLIDVRDGLAEAPARHYSVVLANPPFGKKSSITVIGENGRADREAISYTRNDFWTTTTNKQINFVQHIASMLAIPGRAAVVLPDNVLFEGGAGETVRDRLLKQFDVHTMLRLPTGIFYAGGVKANVLFFDKKEARPGRPWTETLWVYDFRIGQHFTLKQNPLRREHLDDFVKCYRPGEPRSTRVETERFRPFSYDELIARDKVNLDISWLKDPALEDADSLLPPEVIAQEIVEDLEAALSEFAAIAEALQQSRSKTSGS